MAMINKVPLEEEVKNNPELRITDIDTLSDWYQKQPHLPKILDKELALFLHINYYRLERTKRTLDSYFTIRTHVPEFFSNRDPVKAKDVRQAMAVVAVFPLKAKSKEGYDIILGKLIDTDPSKYNYNTCMKYSTMVTDYFCYTRRFSPGQVLLVDLNGVSFGHVGRLSPLGIKKILVYLQEGMPIRLKAVHLFNVPPAWDLIFNMIKPFIKKGLINRVHMHATLDSLAEFVDIDILPNECGGKAGPTKSFHQETIKSLEENRAWFVHDEKNNRVNETLRPGKGKNEADLFGVQGSFKKLDID